MNFDCDDDTGNEEEVGDIELGGELGGESGTGIDDIEDEAADICFWSCNFF